MTRPTAGSARRPGEAARAGLAHGVVVKALGAFVALGPREARLAHAVARVDARGLPGGVRVVIAAPCRPHEAPAIAFPTRPGLMVADLAGPEVAVLARLAVDAGRVVAAAYANAPAFKATKPVEASAVGLNLGVEEATVRVSETFALFALVAGDELALAPDFLVVHGTALVAKRTASVVLTFAFVFLGNDGVTYIIAS